MPSGKGNENCEKTTIGLISKKASLHVQHTFFCTFLCRCFLYDYNVKVPETQYTFFGGNVVCVLVHFLFHFCSFSPCIGGRQNSSCCHHRYKIFMLFFQQKNSSFVFFYLSLQISVALFIVELRWPAVYFLCLSPALYSKFVYMTINLSLILQTTRIQKQFPLSVLVFINYSLVVMRVAM